MTHLRPAIGYNAKVAIALTWGCAVFITASSMAQAGDAFGSSVPLTQLSGIRGGDNTNSNNVTQTASSTQTITATNGGNTVTGDLSSGAINVNPNAVAGASGMTNMVMNTGPAANVQGIMSLNVVLH